MSAECQRCGWDLPYDGDCVVCDENGTFCSQLADALEAAGKKTQPKAKVHSATCWAEQMCVPCTKNALTLAEAETAGLASKLLDVQRELAEQRANHNLIVGAYESRKGQLKESLQTVRTERDDTQDELERVEADNARLQARVEEVEALEEEWRSEAMMWEGRLTAAEALAERRGEALEGLREDLQVRLDASTEGATVADGLVDGEDANRSWRSWLFDVMSTHGDIARAAIEEEDAPDE